MDKGPPPTLFVNDGSFMERFRQLQQEQEKGKNAKPEDSKPIKVVSGPLTPKPSISKANDAKKSSQGGSSGKLAFSLKQKSKLVPPPVKLADDDEDEIDTGYVSNDAPTKRQKLGQDDGIEQSSRQVDVAPPPPSDPTVKKVADKLASFVAKNGRPFEDVTRQKNPGDTPFKFLFDVKCSDYKYYEHRLAQEEKALSQSNEPQAYQTAGTSIPSSRPTNGPQRLSQQQSSYQIPASALYDSVDVSRGSGSAGQAFSVGSSDEPGGSSNANSLALMEFYMKKAAQEEKFKQPRHSKDEMPPPPSLQGSTFDASASGKKGHHMGDYIPQEELEKFLASCNDAAAMKAAKEAAERAKIQADNVGHKLLSKMGWKEGEGLGGSRKGIADPIMAGSVKKDNLGVGAVQPGEVTPEDDIYEQYKKRMMLGYRHRPNPLNADWPQQDSLNRVQLDLLEAFQVAIMDTGLRKTLISVLLIKETGQAIRSTGVKILIVFLAPTGHLVNEIAAYGSKGVDTWNLKSWQKEISDNDVLVLDVAVNGGTKVSDKEFVVTTELLMRKLLKVDGIKAEGDARLQRKAEIVHSIALFRVDFAGRGELTERQIIPTTSTNNTRLSQGRQLI